MSAVSAVWAGWARQPITPPAGIHMGGYWGRTSGAVGIHDPLWASVIVWRAGDTATAAGAVLVALDLVAVSAGWVSGLRRRLAAAVAEAAAVAPEAVTVCCSHTHAGPLSLAFRGMGDVDAGYLESVSARVEDAARVAAAGLRPVRLRYARAPVQIGVNRRQGRSGQVVIGHDPDGPVAPHAHVLVLEAEGRAPLPQASLPAVDESAGKGRDRAVLFQHACHPVVLGNGNHHISADFPGPACRVVERALEAFPVFVNGAAGDINPCRTAGTFDDVDNLGTQLGEAVVAAARDATEVDAGGGLAWTRQCVDLPLSEPPAAMRAAVERAAQELKTALRTAGADVWARRVPQARLDWSRALLRLAREPERERTQPFEVHGLRLGPVVLLGMEGEIFVRYQLDLEAQTPSPLILCGYANGCVGYVPTAQEYARGGYEVDEAYKVYPSVLMIAPESEALVGAAARRAVAAVAVTGR